MAFIIEFDNEFEHRVPHRTTNHGSTGGSSSAPWLVSMAMWLKFMRFVPPDGISAGDLYRCTEWTEKKFRTYLIRMSKWWGYVSLKANASDGLLRGSPAQGIVLPTRGGQMALEARRPLTSMVGQRWQVRFGKGAVEQLRKSLQSLVEKFDSELPDFLPILGYALLSKGKKRKRSAPAPLEGAAILDCTLPVLLAKVLMMLQLSSRANWSCRSQSAPMYSSSSASKESVLRTCRVSPACQRKQPQCHFAVLKNADWRKLKPRQTDAA